jgi:hypothetical protein
VQRRHDRPAEAIFDCDAMGVHGHVHGAVSGPESYQHRGKYWQIGRQQRQRRQQAQQHRADQSDRAAADPRHQGAGQRHADQRPGREPQQRQPEQAGTDAEPRLKGWNMRDQVGEGETVDEENGGDGEAGRPGFVQRRASGDSDAVGHGARIRIPRER